MLERMVECEDVMKKVLDEKGYADIIAKKSHTEKKRISDKDWKIMKNVEKVLNPFKSATEQLSANAACIIKSIPIVSMLQKTLDVCGESDQGVKDLKKRLSDNLRRRTAGMEDLDNYTLATLLDNRFKNHFFQDPEKKIKAEERLKELLEVEVSKLADVEVVVEATATPST